MPVRSAPVSRSWPRWFPLVAAVGTGGLVALAAPGVLPWAWGSWLAWIAFVPLLATLPDVSPRRAALLGAAAGFVLHLGACAWLPGLMARFNGLHPALAVLVAVLLSMAQSLGWGVWAGSVRLLAPRWPLALVAPIAFVAMESLMPMVFPYTVGLTQYRNLAVIQLAELGGPTLVSALLVATGAAGAGLVRSGRRAWRPFAVVAATLVILLAAGWGRLRQVHDVRWQAPTMRVGWVQAGTAITGWSPPPPDPGVLERYQTASARLEREHGPVDLLLWPEKAYGLLARDAEHDYRRNHPRRIREGFTSPLLFGHTSVDRETRSIGNAAAYLEEGGRLRVVYEKVKLIPYSEWLPGFLEGKVGRGKRYRAGEWLDPVVVERPAPSGAKTPVGVFICFESTFPSFVRSIAGRGGRVLVNLSDDTWFGDSAEPEQHLAHTVFRAVENRRDVVRATGGGISAIVAGTGRIVQRTELNRRVGEVKTAAGEVRLLETSSLYGALGPTLPIACAVAWGLGLIGVAWSRRHQGSPPSKRRRDR